VYAVLDGHHRYYAYLQLGRKEIDCALAGNSAVFFYATKLGLLQPSPEVTERVVIPAIQFNDNLEQYLSDFQKNPNKFRRMMRDYVKRISRSMP